jgi:hypothetical protein
VNAISDLYNFYREPNRQFLHLVASMGGPTKWHPEHDAFLQSYAQYTSCSTCHGGAEGRTQRLAL